SSMICAGAVRNVLVVGSESLSRIVDWTDRATCVLFGDGAGAVVVSRGEHASFEPQFVLGSDGSGAFTLWLPGGGSRAPAREGGGSGDHGRFRCRAHLGGGGNTVGRPSCARGECCHRAEG